MVVSRSRLLSYGAAFFVLQEKARHDIELRLRPRQENDGSSHTTEVVDNKKSTKQRLNAFDEKNARLYIQSGPLKENIEIDERRSMIIHSTG